MTHPPAAQTPLLFSRVVRAVLLWFSAPPLYYQWPSDPLMNNRNVEAIERFILVLGVRARMCP